MRRCRGPLGEAFEGDGKEGGGREVSVESKEAVLTIDVGLRGMLPAEVGNDMRRNGRCCGKGSGGSD